MSDYFTGRRSAGNFVLNLVDGKVQLECTIWQMWQPIVHSVIMCGRKQSFTITRRVGVTQAEKQSIEGAIEGSVGIAAVTSMKSSVKGILQHDIAWETETSSSQNFEFEAPKCGHLTALIVQLVRSYDFHYHDKRFLHRDSWSTNITEHTIYIYDGSKRVEWDERCQCRTPDPGDYDGLLKMVVGSVSALVPYRKRSADHFDLQIGDRNVPLKIDPSKGFQASVRAEWLPQYLPFLLGKRAESYPTVFVPYEEMPIEVTVGIVARMAGEPVTAEPEREFNTPHPYLER